MQTEHTENKMHESRLGEGTQSIIVMDSSIDPKRYILTIRIEGTDAKEGLEIFT